MKIIQRRTHSKFFLVICVLLLATVETFANSPTPKRAPAGLAYARPENISYVYQPRPIISTSNPVIKFTWTDESNIQRTCDYTSPAGRSFTAQAYEKGYFALYKHITDLAKELNRYVEVDCSGPDTWGAPYLVLQVSNRKL